MDSRPQAKLVMAKELVDYFREQGVEIHYAYARAIIRSCPASVRGRYVRPLDAWTYWCLHPELRPFGRQGKQHGLAERPENS
jgi:hypothetical protein